MRMQEHLVLKFGIHVIRKYGISKNSVKIVKMKLLSKDEMKNSKSMVRS